MRNILLSILVVTAIASGLVGGTLAGFSDTERSLNNFFEVGDLDLKVATASAIWTPGEYRDDAPWGVGLEPLFMLDCARIGQTYSVNRLLTNYGYVNGIAKLHVRVTQDTTGIAGTTIVTIWYDDNGNSVADPGETQNYTLAQCNPAVLGPLPGGEVRRLTLSICPQNAPGGSQAFDIWFDTEFQLIEDVCPGFTDTEFTTNHLKSCNQGCTHGYWKNHTESWPPTGYLTSQKVKDVFSVPNGYAGYIKNATLLGALDFQGGNSLDEKAEILLKQAVAALLNAAHPSINYPLSVSEVISQVNAALASLNPTTITNLATLLDDYNKLGCPLN
jgi:hypothetical protein